MAESPDFSALFDAIQRAFAIWGYEVVTGVSGGSLCVAWCACGYAYAIPRDDLKESRKEIEAHEGRGRGCRDFNSYRELFYPIAY